MTRTNPQWKEKKALLRAVVDGDVARAVQLCNEGVPPDKRAVHAAPFPIEVAVALGNYDLAEALFAKGAYPANGTSERRAFATHAEKKLMYDEYREWSEYSRDLPTTVLSRAIYGTPRDNDLPEKLWYAFSGIILGMEIPQSQWTWDDEVRWYRLLERYGCMRYETFTRDVLRIGTSDLRDDEQVDDRARLAHRAKRLHFALGTIRTTADCVPSLFKCAFEQLDAEALNTLLVRGFHYPLAAYRSYGFEFTDAPLGGDADGRVLRVHGAVGPRDPLHTPEEAAEAAAEHLKYLASRRGGLFLRAVRHGVLHPAPTDPPVNLGLPYVWEGGRSNLEEHLVYDPMPAEELARKVRAAHDRAFVVYERICKNKMSGPWGRYKQRFWLKSLTTFWWVKVSKLSIPPEKGGTMDMEADAQASMEGLAEAHAEAAEAHAEAAEA